MVLAEKCVISSKFTKQVCTNMCRSDLDMCEGIQALHANPP